MLYALEERLSIGRQNYDGQLTRQQPRNTVSVIGQPRTIVNFPTKVLYIRIFISYIKAKQNGCHLQNTEKHPCVLPST